MVVKLISNLTDKTKSYPRTKRYTVNKGTYPLLMMEQICSMQHWEHGPIWKRHSLQLFLMHVSPVKEEKENLNQSCEYLLSLFTGSSISVALYSFHSFVTNFNQFGCRKFNINTSVVLLPLVENQAFKSVSRRHTVNRNGSSFYYLMG